MALKKRYDLQGFWELVHEVYVSPIEVTEARDSYDKVFFLLSKNLQTLNTK
jgi:hypothetical protein